LSLVTRLAIAYCLGICVGIFAAKALTATVPEPPLPRMAAPKVFKPTLLPHLCNGMPEWKIGYWDTVPLCGLGPDRLDHFEPLEEQ
jgi:hypothetical protein